MADQKSRDLDKMAKGWSIAMQCSKKRLDRVYALDESRLSKVVEEGYLVLETVCLFVHSCVKSGQYLLPPAFWRLLQIEYGIVVYPSALTENIDPRGLDVDFTFTEVYDGHIVMHRSCDAKCPSRCPFQYLREPPPAYDEICQSGSSIVQSS
ncbi:hypothetical protein ESCO_004149 [Escovopsis weberi]|uniref:Uncharacterized protein n=1 Tax=Escovopsis weberi TaxID=150374 RepID=A0A0M8MXF8_ESCWE|nr:hypothetical protein ESCO_004149 [Escovopsis weberi]